MMKITLINFAAAAALPMLGVVWAQESSKPELLLQNGHKGMVLSVAFSPDGKTLASGSRDNTIGLWEVSSGRLIRSFEGHGSGINSVAFSPDGKTLASGSDDETIKLWEVSSGRLIRSFEGHSNWVESVAFSPDGKTLASGSYDTTIKIWSTDTGNLLVSLIHFDDGNWIAFTPDNYYSSSAGASKYITWRVGNQIHDEAQFKSRFNQPSVITTRLSGQ